ncbi:MAG: NUDIX hydrolase [Agarilytica sp.]
MKKPNFSNRHNEETLTQDGRRIWLSRACAVVAHVALYEVESGQWFILLGKRGESTPDFQGYWGLPCGYLDWDESLVQAMLREVWEECGLYLPSLSEAEQFVWSQNSCVLQQENIQETPWAIADVPRSQKQNVSMHYAVLFSWRGQPLPELSDAYAEPGEVAGIEWVSIEKAMEMDLAFHHGKRIQMLWQDHSDAFLQVEQASKRR